MSIIITGMTGFVGQNLEKYLNQHHIETVGLNLRDQDWRTNFPKQAKAVIHLAGKAHDTTNTSADEEYFKINRDLTIALFEEFLRADIQDFFYFSSVKAVADTVEGILDENVQGKPITAYGKSKLEAENFLLKLRLPDNKRLFIIRPCMIHGPGNKGNLNLLYSIVKKGIPWPLAEFQNQRSFLSIDNLSFLIEQMLARPELKSGIYNFADDDSLSTNELVYLISETLGKKAKLWHIPAGLIRNGARIGDVLPLPLNSERLKKLTESYVVSNTKIKSALGIEKLPLTTKKGLKLTIRSFQNNS
ncbi:NAD-dependent epimerase/dehydratase family protein [Sphingobacterium sp. BIGb0165]|uniref:NAD-dependent epimerase/dehydratase family protein n=1 Tax=Sphingobacterium sp. BIGb0165 TaxID=2940615 RepID=UPI002168DEC3|nr:NAD-dependent epimerase/dehydratase family protein [Sphingobacterium sp. BIGb0165]MCS4227942.1 nucleoside-diphosphate-sugar epimerase [Sphingobacterium sp. BIGb0165]